MAKTPPAIPDQDQFDKDLQGEDDLGVVIRAHIHIEQQLNTCINELIPFPKALKPMELDFSQRVHLLVALGLKEEFKRPLLALGNLRNEFAHRLDAALTEGRVKSFYDTFGGHEKDGIHQSLDRTRKRLGMGAKSKMKHQPPKDRFILYAISLHAALLVALMEIRKPSDRQR